MNKSDASSRDSGVLSSPLSFLRSGNFRYQNASIGNRTSVGMYWIANSNDTQNSNSLYFYAEYVNTHDHDPRGMGFAVRCVRPSKSFITLINTSYSMKSALWTGDNQDSGVLSNPVSFLLSGDFNWNGASLYGRGGAGDYWLLRSHSTTYSNELFFGNTNLGPQRSDDRGSGFAVRWGSALMKIYAPTRSLPFLRGALCSTYSMIFEATSRPVILSIPNPGEALTSRTSGPRAERMRSTPQT